VKLSTLLAPLRAARTWVEPGVGGEPVDSWDRDQKFDAQPPVAWLAPGELVRAGVKAVVSKAFGSYADRRELLKVLEEPDSALSPLLEFAKRSNREDVDAPFWFDFVADIGDGFSATYAIAELLTAPGLRLGAPVDSLGFTVPADATYERAEIDARLPRGEVLVMGGDEIYPAPVSTPWRDAYWDRTVGPYELARDVHPTTGGDAPPRLYAIPGNHDWYDGLVAFLKVFSTRGNVAAWKTEQTRSYFALALPYHWWIWGIDIAFEGPLDMLQMDFFKEKAELLEEDDAVILCTAKPTWLESDPDDPHDPYTQLRTFVDDVVPPRVQVPLMLSGDKHFYARHVAYEVGADGNRARSTKVVSGGGGASLSLTNLVADDPMLVRERKAEGPRKFVRERLWPSKDRCRHSIAASAFYRIPATWSFCVLLTAVYLLPTHQTRRASSGFRMNIEGFVEAHDGYGWWTLYKRLLDHALGSTGFIIAFVVTVGVLTALARAGRAGRKALPTAVLHGAGHVGGVVLVVSLATWSAGSDPELALVVSGVIAVLVVLGTAALNLQEMLSKRKWLAVLTIAGLLVLGVALVIDNGDDADVAASAYLLITLVASYLTATVLFCTYLFLAQLVNVNTVELAGGLRHEGWKQFLRMRIDAGGIRVHALGMEQVNRRSIHWEPDAKPPLPRDSAEGEGEIRGWKPTIRGRRSKVELIDCFHVPHPRSSSKRGNPRFE
jgi:hypothetical protein